MDFLIRDSEWKVNEKLILMDTDTVEDDEWVHEMLQDILNVVTDS